jgi:hypothetical protein
MSKRNKERYFSYFSFLFSFVKLLNFLRAFFRCSGLKSCHVTSSSTSFEDLCPETPKYTEVQYRCANTTSAGSSGDGNVDRQQLRFRDDKISRVWEPVVVKHVSQSDILLSLNTSRGIVSVSNISNSSNINSRNASANHMNTLADPAQLESSATVTAQDSETVAPMIVDAAETGNTTQDQSLVASHEENSNTDMNEEKEELSEKKVITIAVVVCASLTVLLIVLSLTSSKVTTIHGMDSFFGH